MAATTSGSSTEPPMMVNVPRQLMMGSTPMARYMFWSLMSNVMRASLVDCG